MRRAAKVDGTQAEIVKALRDAGCKVLSLAACGNGVPDLLVKVNQTPYEMYDEMYLLEVKNPAGRGTKLTAAQVEFHKDWPVAVVTNAAEALAAVGLEGQP